MGSKTGIEWTDATWNPIIGCSRVSEGCRHCYAETIAGRAVWTGHINETRQLLQPLSWRQPKRVFVNSMSDLFHENVSDELRDRIFAVMALCPQHTFQVLTKRPERMLEYCSDDAVIARLARAADDIAKQLGGRAEVNLWQVDDGFTGICLPNLWLGVSVEHQDAAAARIPLLLKTPAAKRFVSCEPLLGPLDLTNIIYQDDDVESLWNTLTAYHEVLHSNSMDCVATADDGVTKLDWVICGGESGPGARPMHPAWARRLRDQCQAASVPFFFKQWGEWGPATNGQRWVALDGHLRVDSEAVIAADAGMRRDGKKVAGSMLDGREWKEFPQ